MQGEESSYAMWLIPSEATLRPLAALVDELARRFGTPGFVPHATLCAGSWPAGPAAELVAAVDAITRQCAAIKVNVDGIGQTDEFFRFFYIQLNADGLKQVVDIARHTLAETRLPSVGPHVSLIYSSEFKRIDRARLRSELENRLPARISFDRLALVMPKNNDWSDVANWQMERAAPFSG